MRNLVVQDFENVRLILSKYLPIQQNLFLGIDGIPAQQNLFLGVEGTPDDIPTQEFATGIYVFVVDRSDVKLPILQPIMVQRSASEFHDDLPVWELTRCGEELTFAHDDYPPQIFAKPESHGSRGTVAAGLGLGRDRSNQLFKLFSRGFQPERIVSELLGTKPEEAVLIVLKLVEQHIPNFGWNFLVRFFN
jgi:hypothetical protein